MFNSKSKPILIRTETAKIKQAKSRLNEAVIDNQEIYNLFKSVGVELTLAEISQWLYKQWLHQPKDHIHDFVADKIIADIGMPNFGGIAIKKEKIKEMIVLPDVHQLEKPLRELSYKYYSGQPGRTETSFKIAYLQLIDGIISKMPDAEATIENEFTHYTQNDRGYELAKKLLEMIDNLTAYHDYLGTNKKSTKGRNLTSYAIPGIVFIGEQHDSTTLGELKLDLNFIRSQERLHEPNNTLTS